MYALKLADQGVQALCTDPGFDKCVNTNAEYLSYKTVPEAVGFMECLREFAR